MGFSGQIKEEEKDADSGESLTRRPPFSRENPGRLFSISAILFGPPPFCKKNRKRKDVCYSNPPTEETKNALKGRLHRALGIVSIIKCMGFCRDL
jgi:hypothetical protein